MSEPIQAWAAAFVKAQAAMPVIAKTKTATIPTKGGSSFTYDYADLPDIIKTVTPVLSNNGLAVAQSVEQAGSGVAVFTRIYHEAGHVESFGPVCLPSGGDARAAGSAITYARRYALCAALGIAADEDDDGQAASSEGPGSSDRGTSPASRPTGAPSVSSPDRRTDPAPQPHARQGGEPTAQSATSPDGDKVGHDPSLPSPTDHPLDIHLKSPGNPDGLSKVQLLNIARSVAKQWKVDEPRSWPAIAELPGEVIEDIAHQARGRVVPA